jgi:hypothetical protein
VACVGHHPHRDTAKNKGNSSGLEGYREDRVASLFNARK